MAATFDSSITYDMLEMIEANREENKMNENQYIQMCNALKLISSKIEQPNLCKQYLLNKKTELADEYNVKLKEYKQLQKKRVCNAIKHVTHVIIAQEHNLFEEKINITLDYWTNHKVQIIPNEETGKSDFIHEYGDIIPKMYIQKYLGGRYIHIPRRIDYGKNSGEFESVSKNVVDYFQNYIINNCSEYNSLNKLKEKYSKINDNEYTILKNKFSNTYLVPIYNEIQNITNMLTDM